MPIYHLKPVVTLLEDPAWESTPYRGEVWVNTQRAEDARALAAGRYEDARANVPGVSATESAWMSERLVSIEVMDAPPSGMDIPDGVVVGDRQM